MINMEAMRLRLQKYLAEAGIASRRKCENIILEGKVSVNDKIITELGVKVNPKIDIVLYNGDVVSPHMENIYLMLHKPIGYVTTSNDQFNRKTVMDLVNNLNLDYADSSSTQNKYIQKLRIFPVGRLDYDSSGLLLMTNDGDLAYKLTHPKHGIVKEYIVKTKGIPKNADIKKLCEGTVIDGCQTSQSSISLIKNNSDSTATLTVKIKEGKNRQIRKMFESVNCTVVNLKRISIGNITLGNLPVGQYRILNPSEISYLKNL